MTLAWGIAGTGRIARSVGAVLAGHPHMRVVAVGSRNGDRAAGLATDLGADASFPSYVGMIEDPRVEAVYVATPHAQHADVVEPALRAGKAVLCEKPLTASLHETVRLVGLARQTGTFLMEAMWMRFNPLVQQLAELVRAGGLGESRSLHASIGFAAPYDAQARLWNPALGGGALLDIGVYAVDLARMLLGEPTVVAATGELAPTGVDAQATLAMAFAGGAHALLDMSLVNALPGTAVVTGTRGYAEVSPSFYAPTRLVVQTDGHDRQVHTVPDRSIGFVREAEEVARCVADGRVESGVLPLDQTVATMRVLDGAASALRVRVGA